MSSKIKVQPENYLDLNLIKANESNGKSRAQSLQDCFKGINLNPLAGVFTQVKESPLVETVQQMAEVSQHMTEQITGLGESLSQIKPAIEAITEVVSKSLPSVQQVIESAIPPINHFGNSLSTIFSGLRLPSFVETITQTTKDIFRSIHLSFIAPLKPLFDRLLEYLKQRYYYPILLAADGDSEATADLAKRWVKYKGSYFLVQRLQGFEADEDDFRATIQMACYEFLYENGGDKRQWMAVYLLARYHFVAKIQAEHRDMSRQRRLSLLSGETIQHYPTYKLEGKEYLFTAVAADLAHRTPQTIRSWIKKGKLPAIEYNYFLRIAKRYHKVYLIPYTSEVLALLQKTAPKATQAEEVFSTNELCGSLGISRMYLHRAKQKGVISPTKIEGKNYYTKTDVVALMSTMNPKSQVIKIQALLNPA